MPEYPLIVLEMANNHSGSLKDGLDIIDAFSWICDRYPGKVGFKFQYRDLDSYIHPDFRPRTDIHYISRFLSTRLSTDDYLTLKEHAHNRGFLTVCTPFDEKSVPLIAEHGYDFLKIASASLTDWPLLEAISSLRLDVIASTAGSSLHDVSRVVTFFRNRNISLALLHCVALYPTKPEWMNLNRIRHLREAFPGLTIGFSTHESPDDISTVQLAVAAGAELFEKHVGMAIRGSLNKYSASPEDLHRWLDAFDVARAAVSEPGEYVVNEEATSLQQLRRGAWIRDNTKSGSTISCNDVFFAMPTVPGQLTANSFGKYISYELDRDLPAEAPIMETDIRSVRNAQDTLSTIAKVALRQLLDAGVHLQRDWELEISHHYGLTQFAEFGLAMITLVNRDYCKKYLILRPGQTHPLQYHRIKEEYFNLLSGELEVTIDDCATTLSPGEGILIPASSVHGMSSRTGAVLEEISSNHNSSDSFYIDDSINKNPNRKTIVRVGALLETL